MRIRTLSWAVLAGIGLQIVSGGRRDGGRVPSVEHSDSATVAGWLMQLPFLEFIGVHQEGEWFAIEWQKYIATDG